MKLAKGDFYALKKQKYFKKTGQFSKVLPINYDIINGRVIIKKELKEACFKPEIMHINWPDKDAIVYMKRDKSHHQQKPFMRTKVNHILPPISTSLSFLLQSIYQSLSWQLKHMKRSFIHNINYPKQALNLSNLFYLSLLILALLTPITSAEERMTSNFIYELIDDSIHLNNQYLFTAKKFVPCDLKIAATTLDDLLLSYNETCNTDFRWKGVTNGDAVEAYDENFILMKGHYNRLEAETICKAMGTNLIEIRNQTDKTNLSIFMGKHLLSTAYAGLQIYEPIREAVFQSDGSIATEKMFSDINYYLGIYDYKHKWEDLLEYEQDEETSGGSFFYKHVGDDLELWINYEKHMEQVPDSIVKHWHLGVASEDRVICKNKHYDQDIKTIIDTDYPIWRTGCKQSLKDIQNKAVIAKQKIAAVMPKNLPSRKDFLTPFLHLDENIQRKDDTGSHSKQTHPTNLLIDANSEWKKMIEGDKLSTDEQCQIWLDSKRQSADRQKRAVPAVVATVATIVYVVFEAANFFFRMIPFLQSLGGNSDDDNQIISTLDDISHSTLQMIRNYQNGDKHYNISNTLTNEQKLKNSANAIFDYVDKSYNEIIDLAYVDHFKPKNPIKFMSIEQFDQIINYVSDKFNQELIDDISQAISYVANTGKSFIIATAIPFKSDASENELYKIHHVPTFINGTQYHPISDAKYMAVAKHTDRYTPLDVMEAFQCSEDKVCSSNSPTFQDSDRNCGYSNFWIEDGKTCKFSESNITRPYFTTIGNRTYFQTGNQTSEIEIDCKADYLNRPGEDNIKNITGYNYFELPFSCHASYKSLTMTPAQRSLKLPRVHLTPQITINRKNTDGPKLNYNDMKDFIPSDPTDPALYITMYTFVATTLLIVIIITVCKKSVLDFIFKHKHGRCHCLPAKQMCYPARQLSPNGSYRPQNHTDSIYATAPFPNNFERTAIVRPTNRLDHIVRPNNHLEHITNQSTSVNTFPNSITDQVEYLENEIKDLPMRNLHIEPTQTTREQHDKKTRHTKQRPDAAPGN